ncbi:MAG: type II toxin-antitoxin system RelE/ParE family toxin [Spirochaetales bacterium]|jgi:putative addiction module killer protein|nr:type II toxin-antitoxin system RelE/ParE family toxin [Spirochaetales bacterium]
MKEIYQTRFFKKWLKRLKDLTGKALIYKRLARLTGGNPGDFSLVGGGLSELRIHYGPGYRVYYKDAGTELIVLLCGGNKSTQAADIVKAKELAKEPLEKEKKDENR